MFERLAARASGEELQGHATAAPAPPPAEVLARVDAATSAAPASSLDCAICLEPMNEATHVRYADVDARARVALPCGHAFHRACCARWVSHAWHASASRRARAVVSCPLCKRAA